MDQFSSDDGQVLDNIVRAVSDLQKSVDELERNSAQGTSKEELAKIQGDIINLYKDIEKGLKVTNSKLETSVSDILEKVDSLQNQIDERNQNNDYGKLQSKLTKQKKKMIQKFLDLRAEAKKNNIALCIADIKDSNVHAALEKFRLINDDLVIPHVILSSCGDSFNHLQSVLNFACNLPFPSQSLIAYDCLFKEMKKKDYLQTQEFFRLAFKVKKSMEAMNSSCAEETKLAFQTLKSGFPSYKMYLFVSNDINRGDNMVEAHGTQHKHEDRNRFVLEPKNDKFLIYNPSYKMYHFVSNDVWSGDNLVEAHPSQHKGEERNCFEIQ
jgi:hypothetical protein